MALCESCGQEMLDHVPCSLERIVLVTGSYERFRYRARPVRNENGDRRTCGDCGVPSGSYHHPGCDMENCPRCRHQLISCGCWEDLESAI